MKTCPVCQASAADHEARICAACGAVFPIDLPEENGPDAANPAEKSPPSGGGYTLESLRRLLTPPALWVALVLLSLQLARRYVILIGNIVFYINLPAAQTPLYSLSFWQGILPFVLTTVCYVCLWWFAIAARRAPAQTFQQRPLWIASVCYALVTLRGFIGAFVSLPGTYEAMMSDGFRWLYALELFGSLALNLAVGLLLLYFLYRFLLGLRQTVQTGRFAPDGIVGLSVVLLVQTVRSGIPSIMQLVQGIKFIFTSMFNHGASYWVSCLNGVLTVAIYALFAFCLLSYRRKMTAAQADNQPV